MPSDKYNLLVFFAVQCCITFGIPLLYAFADTEKFRFGGTAACDGFLLMLFFIVATLISVVPCRFVLPCNRLNMAKSEAYRSHHLSSEK